VLGEFEITERVTAKTFVGGGTGCCQQTGANHQRGPHQHFGMGCFHFCLHIKCAGRWTISS